MLLFENLSYKTLIKAAVAEGNFGPRRTYDPTDLWTASPKACVVPVRAILTPPPWLLMNYESYVIVADAMSSIDPRKSTCRCSKQ